MSTMIRNTAKTKAIAVIMSTLLVIVSLMSFAAGSRNAYADPTPYTPLPEVAPAYTGPLNWMNHTQPSNPPSIPIFMDIDDGDNLYVIKRSTQLGNTVSLVEKIPSDGQTVTYLTYDAALKYSYGIAVDIQGNVYVSDNSKDISGNSGANTVRILKLPYGGDSWEPITFNAAMSYVYGIAVDKQGTLYAVDGKINLDSNTTPRILKLPSGGISWSDITGNASPFTFPMDIAVDGEGNVFVSDITINNTKIHKLPFGKTDWINVAPTPFMAYGLNVDKFDNLYTINFINSSVMKLKYGRGTDNWNEIPIISNPLSPIISYDVVSDSSGYLYATSMNQGPIIKLMASVIYNGNGNTTGTAPNDTAGYRPNVIATVYGNTGNLAKTGYVFSGWSTSSSATEATYTAGDTINMSQSVTLYAVWKAIPSLTEIALDSTGYSLNIGSTHQTVVSAVYSDNSKVVLSSGVSYSSSNQAIATVNGEGLVTAVSDGQSVITAEFEGRQAQANVTVEAPSEPSSDSPGNSTPGAIITKPGVEIIIDGVKQGQLATAQQDTVDGRTVTTIVLDSKKVIDKLEQDNNKLLTIPLSGDSKVVIGQLNGSLVKTMESKDAQIQIVTERATYTLPASQINIDSISEQLGTGVKLEDITIHIQISETSDEQTAQVQAAAQRNQFEMVAHPVDFEISASYGSQNVQANKFNSYVGRMIALPDGIKTENITTGVVLTADGDLFHVPTVVVQQDGKTYANINSLTNSTYSVIHNPREIDDVKGHWANEDVNDMSSRLIIQGVTATEFRPDAPITRAEFAAIVTRGLGIQDAPYADTFTDVDTDSWYAGVVQTAVNYKLIDGYEDGTFRPAQNISRQEATAVLSRATGIAKLKTELSAAEVDSMLSAFTDGSNVASWARMNVAAAISLNLMNGRGDMLDLDANLTRAETAALVRRFLQAAQLINP